MSGSWPPLSMIAWIRSADDRASASAETTPASSRTSPVMVSRYVANTTKVPTPISPRRVIVPPTPMTRTSANCGRVIRTGVNTEFSRATRRRRPNSAQARARKRFSTRSSRWKTLVTGSPAMASPVNEVRSAAACWDSQVAAWIRRRERTTSAPPSGTVTSVASASTGESTNMITIWTVTWHTAAAACGARASSDWITCRSVTDRDTTSPRRNASCCSPE